MSFIEFCEKAVEATQKGKGLKFPRYEKNLRYDSEGIYSYGTKIANLDLGKRTIHKLGYWSPTNSKHYNYAKIILNDWCGFFESLPEPSGANVQYLRYWDHT